MPVKKRFLFFLICLSLAAVPRVLQGPPGSSRVNPSPGPPPISGNLVFFYYRDLPGAVGFYRDTLGLTEVLDYGFARIFRISQSTFIGLVDEKQGMHSADDPKTVTLSFITPHTDQWYACLQKKGLEFRSPLQSSSRIHIRGFVTRDPEGYLLEFQKFLDHPMNEKLNRRLRGLKLFPTAIRWKDRRLGFLGNIVWLYYRDLPGAGKFYREQLDLRLLCDQRTSVVMDSSPSGFIGLVDETRGLHRYTEAKAVSVAFLVNNIRGWYRHLREAGRPIKRELGPAENNRLEAFMTTDPAGYILEFDRFLPHPDNLRLLRALRK